MQDNKHKLRLKPIFSVLMSLALTVSVFTPVSDSAADSGVIVLDEIKGNISDDTIVVGLTGNFKIADRNKVVDKLNQIRKEACDLGVVDPRDESGTKHLSPSDYVPIHWSDDLERTAMVRAAEATLSGGHARPCLDKPFSAFPDYYTSYMSETLAWNNGDGIEFGINQWYEEKDYWVNQTNLDQTGHYESIINPQLTYVGVSCFYNDNATMYYGSYTCYWDSVAASFSASPTVGELAVSSGKYIQKIQALGRAVTDINLADIGGVNEGKTKALDLRATIQYNSPAFTVSFNTTNTNALVYSGAEWKSSDESVATVDEFGVVTGVSKGNCYITATLNGISKSIPVDIYGESETVPTDPPSVSPTPSSSDPTKEPGPGDETPTPGPGDETPTPSPGDETPTPTPGGSGSNPTVKPSTTPSYNYNSPPPGSAVVPSKTATNAAVEDAIAIGDVVQTDKAAYVVLDDESKEVEFSRFSNSTDITSYTIPNYIYIDGVAYTVSSIGKAAFKGNKTLKSITIGSNITEIYDSAFERCSKLKYLVIGSGVRYIGKNAFRRCSALKQMTVRTKLLKKRNIGTNAFLGIKKSCSVIVPAQKIKLYKKVFPKKGLPKKCNIR